MNAAAAYLGGFAQLQKVPGFEGVRSDDFTRGLGAVPGMNLSAGAQLANTALGEIGRLREQDMLSQQLQMRLDYERKAANRLAGAGLLTAPSALLSLLGGSGSGSGARTRGVADDNWNQQQSRARADATGGSSSLSQSIMKIVGAA